MNKKDKEKKNEQILKMAYRTAWLSFAAALLDALILIIRTVMGR